MRVMKFGGSSVATPERIRGVTNIILEAVKEEPVIVVVSAFQGVSSKLLACANLAASADSAYLITLSELADQHRNTIKSLIPENHDAIIKTCDVLLEELNEILQGIFLLKELTNGAKDNIASFGERLSANILAAYINNDYPSQYVDARKFIITDDRHTAANVIFDRTNTAIEKYYNEHFANQPIIPIVTGFIGMTEDGRTTTLGRNSSDYSATIIGGALNASRVEIWTDVDGVYSADPNLVPNAFILPTISYLEAIELSYFGSKVLHALTFQPVIENEIPVVIKNTLNPECHGSYVIAKQHRLKSKKWNAKSITSVDDITLLVWKTTGTTDVTHIKERLFRSLSNANIQTFLHLEGSPKNTVYIAIKHHDLEKANQALQQEFALEFKHELVTIEEKPSQCIIAIIGDDMKKLPPESAGKMFQLLGRMDVKINAIVYGASERNICIVIDKSQRVRALNLIHQAFFSDYKRLAILMIGAGRVGKALLQQLWQQRQAIIDKKIELTIHAVSNSKHMIENIEGINLETCIQDLSASTKPFTIASFLQMISPINCNNIALLDCTASDEVVESYPLFIQEGVHIITPNKRANVLPYPQYESLIHQFNKHHARFLYRTNVGAGLPVLSILRDLLNTGDEIIKIEGILSGTLSYVFNHYDGTTPFSEVLRKAQDLQLTEPDPREDLSGIDVGRKLLILTRQMGWEFELSNIHVESLIPKGLTDGAFTPDFFSKLDEYEHDMKTKLDHCHQHHKVMRYVGTIDVQAHTASARLIEIPTDHPLALSCYSDNIISFTTHHYHDAPLVIRGPGAGVECTAQGVFSDILDLISRLPD